MISQSLSQLTVKYGQAAVMSCKKKKKLNPYNFKIDNLRFQLVLKKCLKFYDKFQNVLEKVHIIMLAIRSVELNYDILKL